MGTATHPPQLAVMTCLRVLSTNCDDSSRLTHASFSCLATIANTLLPPPSYPLPRSSSYLGYLQLKLKHPILNHETPSLLLKKKRHSNVVSLVPSCYVCISPSPAHPLVSCQINSSVCMWKMKPDTAPCDDSLPRAYFDSC